MKLIIFIFLLSNQSFSQSKQCSFIFSERYKSAQRMERITADRLRARVIYNIAGHNKAIVYADRNSDFFTAPIVRHVSPQTVQVIFKRKHPLEQTRQDLLHLKSLENLDIITKVFRSKLKFVTSIHQQGFTIKETAEVLYLRDQLSEYISFLFYDASSYFMNTSKYLVDHRISISRTIDIYNSFRLKNKNYYEAAELAKNFMFERQADVNSKMGFTLMNQFITNKNYAKKRGKLIDDLLIQLANKL